MDQSNFYYIAKILKPVLNSNILMALYEEQWRKMPFVKWNDCFGEESGQNFNVFLSNVGCYKDSAGSKPFKQLVKLVFNILCVPTSNAMCLFNNESYQNKNMNRNTI